MEANADNFLELIHQFEDFTDAVSPEQAHTEFDETTLQIFWMRWPQLSAWTGSLWRMLSEEMSGPSAPHRDPELDEVGESGLRHQPPQPRADRPRRDDHPRGHHQP
jgi:hypothetical protein